MASTRSAAAVVFLALLVPALLPLAEAHLPGQYPRELPDAADPACADASGTCQGVNDTLRDVGRVGVPNDKPEHDLFNETNDVAHPVQDHLLPGACSDHPETCASANETLAPAKTAAAPYDPVVILSPRSGEGARPGSPVTITWKANVSDFANTGQVFRVEERPAVAGLDWDNVPGYRCWQEPTDDFPHGTCQVTWQPDETGIYNIRVVAGPTPVDTTICDLDANCALVPVFYVDGTPPSVDAPCAVSSSTCLPAGTRLGVPAIEARAGARDDLALANLTFTATGPLGSSSCVVGARGEATFPAGETCDVDLTRVVPQPSPGAFIGDVSLVAVARDAAGNLATSGAVAYHVDTSPVPVVAAAVVGDLPAFAANNASVNLTVKLTYLSPPERAGLPAAGVAWSMSAPSGPSCGGVSPINGIVTCAFRGSNAVLLFTAGANASASLASVPVSAPLTWTSLALARAPTLDVPRNNGFANDNEAYAPAFRVTFTHNGSAATGALVSTRATSFPTSFDVTGANGLAFPPQVSAHAATVSFPATATLQDLSASGSTGAITWTSIVVSNATLGAPFVNVNDTVTLAGNATYEHNGSAVKAASLDVDASAPAGCRLVSGSVSNGALAARITCAAPAAGPIPLRVVSGGALGITALRSPLEAAAAWSSIDVSGLSAPAFADVGQNVTLTGSATWTHNGSAVPNATVVLAPGAPAGCSAAGAVTDGALSVTLSCATVTAGPLALRIASAPSGVTTLAHPFADNTTWTRIVVSGFALDRSFVNVTDGVALSGSASYAHAGAPPVDATLALGPSAPAGCALANGRIAAGALQGTLSCANVTDASATGIPLVVAGSTTGVTQLAQPLAAHAVWTEIVLSGATLDRAFVNAGDTVTLTATAKFAHDNSSVESANVTLGPGAPAGCALLSGGVSQGTAAAAVRCAGVQDLRQDGLALALSGASHNITRVREGLAVKAVWTEIQLSGLMSSDPLVHVGDNATLTANATWAHDGSPVSHGVVALVGAPAGCAG